MKILYLHGLNSRPTEEKIEILRNYSKDVYAPVIDWENPKVRKTLFMKLSDLIRTEGITHVIGSSMGGQMAFYLSNYSDINGMCFNPAFNYLYSDFGFTMNGTDKKILINLGKMDKVVDYKYTIDFVNKFNLKNVSYNMLNIGHNIDVETFSKCVDIFMN